MTPKQKAFIHEYLVDFNATQAAIRAGYSKKTSRQIGQQNLSKLVIADEIERLVNERIMGLEEAQFRLGKIARFDISPYIEGYGKRAVVRTDKMIEDGYGDLIREMWQTSEGVRVKIADPDAAVEKVLKIHGAFVDRSRIEHSVEPVRVKFIDYGLDDNDSD